jgi:bifunctional ADP-heptose synthase (sugar kinase/adenylyltransferase)
MLALLERSYGPLTDINAEDTFVRPGDPKSSRRWSLSYGGARVVLEVGLNGTVRVDGHGHQSNQACADRAAAVVADMRGTGSVSATSVDNSNRSQERRSEALHEASEVMQAVDRLASRIV